MTRTMAVQNGMAFTHVWTRTKDQRPPSGQQAADEPVGLFRLAGRAGSGDRWRRAIMS